jgi:hypothetical protein
MNLAKDSQAAKGSRIKSQWAHKKTEISRNVETPVQLPGDSVV